MKKVLILVGIIVLIVLVVFLAKRGSGPAPQNPSPMLPVTQTTMPSKTDTPQSVGMANPASTFCIDNGGTLATVKTDAGASANCTLPNGTVCDEWKLFRGECVAEGVVNKATYTKGTATVTAVFHIKAGTVILDAPTLNITALELKATEAASGAKYATPDEKITFWEHQGEATITQDGKETFMGMITK